MTLSLEKTINAKLAAVFNELNLNPQFAAVKVSDRPDLSDFQCNGALALAKAEKKNPREIASAIAPNWNRMPILPKCRWTDRDS